MDVIGRLHSAGQCSAATQLKGTRFSNISPLFNLKFIKFFNCDLFYLERFITIGNFIVLWRWFDDKISYRVTHKGCDFGDLKSSKFTGALLFVWPLNTFIKNIGNKNTVSDLLESTEFVKTRLDKLSTVVVIVASFVGPPVYITESLIVLSILESSYSLWRDLEIFIISNIYFIQM